MEEPVPLPISARTIPAPLVLIEYATSTDSPPGSNFPNITPELPNAVVLNHASMVQSPLPGSSFALSNIVTCELLPLKLKYGFVYETLLKLPLNAFPLKSYTTEPDPL
jgi:hypothetical protein